MDVIRPINFNNIIKIEVTLTLTINSYFKGNWLQYVKKSPSYEYTKRHSTLDMAIT